MRTLMSVAAIMAAFVSAPETTSTSAAHVAPRTSSTTPEHVCSASSFRLYVRAVYRRDVITAKALRHIDLMRACLKPWALRYQRSLGRSRFRRMHPWEYERSRIPQWGLAMLARLRWCESTNNYRATNGSHWGAYQFSWGPGSAGARAGFAVRPDMASPAEQDARTFRFYPSHRGEWACSA